MATAAVCSIFAEVLYPIGQQAKEVKRIPVWTVDHTHAFLDPRRKEIRLSPNVYAVGMMLLLTTPRRWYAKHRTQAIRADHA